MSGLPVLLRIAVLHAQNGRDKAPLLLGGGSTSSAQRPALLKPWSFGKLTLSLQVKLITDMNAANLTVVPGNLARLIRYSFPWMRAGVRATLDSHRI